MAAVALIEMTAMDPMDAARTSAATPNSRGTMQDSFIDPHGPPVPGTPLLCQTHLYKEYIQNMRGVTGSRGPWGSAIHVGYIREPSSCPLKRLDKFCHRREA